MEQEKRIQLSDDELYSISLQEINQLAGEIEAERCKGNQYAQFAVERTPYEQRVMEIWFDRNRRQLTEKNQKELLKELNGGPNDLDPYAPF